MAINVWRYVDLSNRARQCVKKVDLVKICDRELIKIDGRTGSELRFISPTAVYLRKIRQGIRCYGSRYLSLQEIQNGMGVRQHVGERAYISCFLQERA